MPIPLRATLTLLLILYFIACRKEVSIPVTVDFSYELVDSSRTVPAGIRITNTTTGAEHYQWTFEGGEPATSTQKNPGIITYGKAGPQERLKPFRWVTFSKIDNIIRNPSGVDFFKFSA